MYTYITVHFSSSRPGVCNYKNKIECNITNTRMKYMEHEEEKSCKMVRDADAHYDNCR